MSFNKTKTNPELGWAVHKYLRSVGVETPGVGEDTIFNDRKERIELIETKFRDIMTALGLDLTDDSLEETPIRVAKMLVTETMWGLDPNNFPKCTAVDNKMKYDEMVVERNVNVQSNCEHHFLPISGVATVAYIPNKKVLGLSKINRVVEYFSKRPQIQERLVEQIFHALSFILETENVAVLIDAKHHCVMSRGVEDTGSSTVTSKLGGAFKSDQAVRAEFMRMVSVGGSN
jgi:GTP cyclohydrolase I